MGYDLNPRNKKLDSFHFGAFSWSWMLKCGVGWILGTGDGWAPGQYVEVSRPDGKSVNMNDRARVTGAEAKEMARFCRHLVRYQRTLRGLYEKEPADRRAEMEAVGLSTRGLYNLPVRTDFVDKVEAFADWAEKSGGFTVG